MPEGARYCPNCGAAAGSLLQTEERKMVTVLFADLVDSTGLAQRFDAERSREFLGRFFDAAADELTALRGRPEKFIGDAVMAVFGLPHVHEDDALRAVRAGLAIRERVRRLGGDRGLDVPLEVRIGLESGEAAMVLVEHLEFDRERLASAAADPMLLATDAAEELVRSGTPFRQAHEQVGRQVRDGDFKPPWDASTSVAKRRLEVAKRARAIRRKVARLKL